MRHPRAERSRRLDRKLKPLAELKASTVAGCEWCIDFGSMLSRGGGITEQQLRDLPRHRDSDAFSELEKLVFDYATATTRTPTEMTDALYESLRRHIDEPQIVELTTAVALENMRARFNYALWNESQEFSEGSFCAVSERAAVAGVSVRVAARFPGPEGARRACWHGARRDDPAQLRRRSAIDRVPAIACRWFGRSRCHCHRGRELPVARPSHVCLGYTW